MIDDARFDDAGRTSKREAKTVEPIEASDDFGDGFWDRFDKARESLDDFGSRPRTRIAG